MSFMKMEHTVDPKKNILDGIGDLSDIEIFNNQLLVAVYLRPEKTKSGLIMPDAHLKEDRYQSKVGLVVKQGPSAFVDPEGKWFDGMSVDNHDWVVFRPSDGWNITINGVLCRIIDDINVRVRIPDPDQVW
jgi:co-chaperonin GroES (HSP10)